MPFQFEWDPGKALENLSNHKVGFDEAATVFSDALSHTIDDPDHSWDENRRRTCAEAFAEDDARMAACRSERMPFSKRPLPCRHGTCRGGD